MSHGAEARHAAEVVVRMVRALLLRGHQVAGEPGRGPLCPHPRGLRGACAAGHLHGLPLVRRPADRDPARRRDPGAGPEPGEHGNALLPGLCRGCRGNLGRAGRALPGPPGRLALGAPLRAGLRLAAAGPQPLRARAGPAGRLPHRVPHGRRDVPALLPAGRGRAVHVRDQLLHGHHEQPRLERGPGELRGAARAQRLPAHLELHPGAEPRHPWNGSHGLPAHESISGRRRQAFR
mmetsp:Transcript_58500/g.166380  ORF Transcript_58500/g.166380 Transcript_58500/m.166380 type:complete len:235 (-) Transcript_58500:1275-1979(-)